MLFNMLDQGVTVGPLHSSKPLTIDLLKVRSRYSLRLAGEDVAKFEKMTKIKLPQKIGESKAVDDLRIARLGPDEWIFLYSDEEFGQLDKYTSKLEEKFPCSVVDISYRNIGYKLYGERVVEAINVGCPLDLALSKFPVGKVTRTVFEDASIILIRESEDEFIIEVWRSFAPYVLNLLTKHVMQS